MKRAPVLFIGHGSPMNAIDINSYTESLSALGKTLARPKAILTVSAHWQTQGTFVTGEAFPKTIHDFGGFPQELFNIQYPAPGSPELADLISTTVTVPKILPTSEWGLDHGTWSVLRHLFPKADVPVLQLSMDIQKSPEQQFALGQQLRSLRDEGVMILGSGNIVHNLRRIDWNTSAPAFEWAIEFDELVKRKLEQRDFKSLLGAYAKSEAGKLSVPTTEHYDPLQYILGAIDASDDFASIFEGLQNASISMRSFRFGD